MLLFTIVFVAAFTALLCDLAGADLATMAVVVAVVTVFSAIILKATKQATKQ